MKSFNIIVRQFGDIYFQKMIVRFDYPSSMYLNLSDAMNKAYSLNNKYASTNPQALITRIDWVTNQEVKEHVKARIDMSNVIIIAKFYITDMDYVDLYLRQCVNLLKGGVDAYYEQKANIPNTKLKKVIKLKLSKEGAYENMLEKLRNHF